MTTYAGPMAAYDFGAASASAFTLEHCCRVARRRRCERRLHARRARLRVRGHAVGRQPGDGRAPRRHAALPSIDGGILFLEDIGEQPYRVERMLCQLHFAGVLAPPAGRAARRVQRLRAGANDNGYDFAAMVAHARAHFGVPDLHGVAVRPLSRQADAAGRRALRAHVRAGAARLTLSRYGAR